MKTVQDRLLTQMVSRYDTFDISAFGLSTFYSFFFFFYPTKNVIRCYGVNVFKPSVHALPSCSTRVRSRL